MFLVFGALTVAWSAAIYFLLPDTQANARFLSQDDRAKAVHRVRENMTGIRNNTWKPSQSFEALLDVKVWLLVAIQVAQMIANGGIQGVSIVPYHCYKPSLMSPQFGSIIIKGFGFSTLNTLLVQMIQTAFQGFFVIVSTVGSSYLPNTRTYFMTANLVISLAGVIMVRQIERSHHWARLIGISLSITYTANIPLILSMSSGNIGGFTKKNTVNSMVSKRHLDCHNVRSHHTRSSLRTAPVT